MQKSTYVPGRVIDGALLQGDDTGSQTNTLCSGFVAKPSQEGFVTFFHWYLCRNRYKVVSSMKML